MGMPGPLELLIVGLVCVAPIVAAIIVLVVVLRSRGASSASSPPCPTCSGWTVPGTKFCPHCGAALVRSTPSEQTE